MKNILLYILLSFCALNTVAQKNLYNIGGTKDSVQIKSSTLVDAAGNKYVTHLDLANAVLNVDDFGAKGDGVTDDHDAIQSCIDSAGVGGIVEFSPKKIYVSGDKLIIKEGQTLIGNNATLRRANQEVVLLADSANIYSTFLKVDSIPTGWKVGDWLQVYKDSTRPKSTYKYSLQISSINGDTLHLLDSIGRSASSLAYYKWPSGSSVRKVYPQITSDFFFDTYTLPTNYTIKGLVIDGNLSQNRGNFYWGVNQGILNSGRVKIENCSFINMPNDCVYGSGFSLINNKAKNLFGSFYHQSSYLPQGKYVLGGIITGCDIDSVCLKRTENGHAEGAITFSSTAGRVIVEGNKFSNGLAAVLGNITYSASPSDGSNRDFVFANNMCYNFNKIIDNFSNIPELKVNNVGNILITNNIFDSCRSNNWASYASAINSYDTVKFFDNILSNGTSLSNIPEKMIYRDKGVYGSIVVNSDAKYVTTPTLTSLSIPYWGAVLSSLSDSAAAIRADFPTGGSGGYPSIPTYTGTVNNFLVADADTIKKVVGKVMIGGADRYSPTYSNVTNITNNTSLDYYYVVSGEYVTVYGHAEFSTSGTGVSGMDFTLPFTADSTEHIYGSGSSRYVTSLASQSVVSSVTVTDGSTASTAYLDFYSSGAQNNEVVHFSLMYKKAP